MSTSAPDAPDVEPMSVSKRSWIVVGVAVAVVLALVVAGVLWNVHRSYPSTAGTVRAENASFIVGDDRAPKTVDVFEDFSCPQCRDFEGRSGSTLAAAARAGQLRVRYHLLTLADAVSPSHSYSSRGAGAIACVARSGDAQVFTRLLKQLFEQAPAHGATEDPSNQQIADLAAASGADTQTRQCIADGAGVDEARTMADTSAKQLKNSNDGDMTTPTVLVGGEQVDSILTGDDWVTDLVTGTSSTR
ncbi:MAG: thioredoxin domain-containing protein [Gordonia sp. (in: high G+C Gram-positive bacteria)]|uniref:DsbA family protein n=1 Tax=Gordonia sp. (in: high G+C Gram-positive bacteria) TaxID=84139 RepID=UPI0039E64177